MLQKATVSIDVSDMTKALTFYVEALGCKFKKKYSDDWQVVSVGTLDLHIQQKASGTIGAADHKRDYSRHWTPVHLDFIVDDIEPICAKIENRGGTVEKKTFSEIADLANCADPFGNGFDLIREDLE
ncbi:glyoxalase [Roseobacter cerasinus]|uniref:Glyoxalase n=1 Tax=Roseobacter cerasinus TaxID=2602289 RepID=A0A640VWD7_9RHOB|nr:VOC family protein [Roseobacter cerasinus]GFE52453.1 glyoxalase [Roseobacter cerasinus]